MVISGPAAVGLEQAWARIERAVSVGWTLAWSRVRGGDAQSMPAVAASLASGAAFAPVEASTPPERVAPSRPRPEQEDQAEPLSAEERRARAAAVRGLMLARKRCYGTAQAAFAEAAALDPELDLARVPTFWELHRAGQETVVRAYEEAGRSRDAAVLAATLRHTYRPRPVPRRGDAAPEV